MTEPDDATERTQLAAEAAHWRSAADALADLDTVASAAAWSRLEDYLRLRVRDRLEQAVADLAREAGAAAGAVATGHDFRELRGQVLRLRTRYLQVETILDFYGDAVASRTNPDLGDVLRGLDLIAGDSLDMILGPLGIEGPPALVYLDKGLGAAILRADVRLWDRASLSPVAAIKLTRHNLSHPTALLHETGHQVAHLTGWAAELGDALESALAPWSRELGSTWRDWSGEVAADVHAFAQAGWAPLPALANVVDGTSDAVFRHSYGDPHPFPWIRVMFNAALCDSWLGDTAGPWRFLAAAWARRHSPQDAPPDTGGMARLSMAAMPTIVDVCTRRPMASFRGRPLYAVADPRHAAPATLEALARRSGPSLLTSPYLARRSSLAILSWMSTRALTDPVHARVHRQALHGWLARLSPELEARVA